MDAEPHFASIVQLVHVAPLIRSAGRNGDGDGEILRDHSRSVAHLADSRHDNAVALAVGTADREFQKD